VADKVIRATKRPVALFRAESARTYVSGEPLVVKYLVPLDGSKESEAVLPYVEELASMIGGEVVFLHVVQPGSAASPTLYDLGTPYTQTEVEGLSAKAEAYMERVCSVLEGKGIKTKCEVRFGMAAEEIIKLADETSADVVAMASHARSFFGRLAIGSTAEKVLHAGKNPLLLVRA
jgi:nucleotide-binding universal stress UspA family protein